MDAIVDDLTAWFDRYLKEDGSPPDTSFSVLVPETSWSARAAAPDPETRIAPAYPGRGVDADRPEPGPGPASASRCSRRPAAARPP